MIGPVVNAIAIIVASLIGLLLRKVLKPEMLESTMSVLGLVVIVIGFDGVTVDITLIYVILSLVIGLWLGESIHLDEKVKSFYLQNLTLKIQTGLSFMVF